jgi:hypothetical protein
MPILITIDKKRSNCCKLTEIKFYNNKVLWRKKLKLKPIRSFDCIDNNGSVQNSCNYSKKEGNRMQFYINYSSKFVYNIYSIFIMVYLSKTRKKGKTIVFFPKESQLQNIRYDWFMLPQMTKMKSAKFGFRFKTFQTCR